MSIKIYKALLTLAGNPAGLLGMWQGCQLPATFYHSLVKGMGMTKEQEHFNELMRGYYRQFGKRRICTHSPQVMFLYRLSAVFCLGSLIGFIIKHF